MQGAIPKASGAVPKAPPAPAAPSTGAEDADATGGNSAGNVAFFEPAETFLGSRPGTVFNLGHLGLGSYMDASQTLLPSVRPKLPEKWRDAVNLREERLKVDPTSGAGISLEHSEYGFVVEGVDQHPGQNVQPGEVIVAMEGRLLVGLSAPQMQASFQKRRVNGTRLHVGSLAEITKLATRDPSIVECWDPQNQHAFFFNKRTGKSAWVEEDLIEENKGAASSSSSSTPAAPSAPIDIASFLTRGFAKEKEAPVKKKKASANAQAEQDESERAREERKRWAEHNDGSSGFMTYTEQFFKKYKGNLQEKAQKTVKKVDKRVAGSVGPGNGMEYMAAWTGSKNSAR